eukprot:CAMPEP_0172320264 /NCGR_PEP_ID=MMETSP1058-20130122/40154_1 /TAXON_ID=83371 /ORGANISM="Detonula confervacea, Strain CCMP 353" /LENGTH=277 /DNA_ID=CAMNT_0013035491 /DNA_START=542 /DNA_END=1375 /DNA_ORIENTATION=+
MFCPTFSSDEELDIHSTNGNSSDVSWDCNDINSGNHAANKKDFPRLFMIGARDEDEDTFHAWKQMLQFNGALSKNDGSQYQHLPHFERINTLKISNQYALSGGALRHSTVNDNHNLNSSTATSLSDTSKKTTEKQFLCRKMKWEHRLFAVYQSVFSNLLATYPDDPGFVIVEDDAVLKNPHAFVQEVCYAHNLQLGFYSLYRSPLQWKGRGSSSCMYLHGTVAFYIHRSMMENIVNERRRGWFCRFPIDMYISKMGPWYATKREIVDHLDMGRVGST